MAGEGAQHKRAPVGKVPVTILHVYLPNPMRQHAEGGQVNIFNRVAAAVAPAGWRLAFHGDGQGELDAAQGHCLFHMTEPRRAGTLCIRRAYQYPFWQIEDTNERWRFDVARATFNPADIDPDAARAFARRWRDKLFGTAPATRDGFIFMPLQGRLADHRSFQATSPLAMIEATLAADPTRPIRATLHPNEGYSDADRAALADLSRRFPRFQVITGDSMALLLACDYVVTQNSSMAMTGFFAEKPSITFAGIDFHHITGSVPRDGLDLAFARAYGAQPDFAAYLFWFFRQNTVNGGASDAEDRIFARFRRFGWPL
jgi:hypothetical protein